MSEHLDEHEYWASYNVPFFDSIREQTGFAEMDATSDSNEYDFFKNPRGVLFAGW